MPSCQCQGCDSMFDKREAISDLKDYRKKGASGTTRTLIEALKAEDIEGLTLLDIGGGVGVIQHELLKTGVKSSVDVDASAAFIDAARSESERLGHADRVAFHHADFVELAEDISPADIVTLDRVVCCYDNMEALVKSSAAHARKLYGVVYPRDTWWLRIVGLIGRALLRLTRNKFRFFIHPSHTVDALLRENGLRQHFYRKTIIWQIVIYTRAAD